MMSVVIPVYKNEDNIPPLMTALVDLKSRLESELEVVFVVDGSPDRSHEVLRRSIPPSGLRAQLLSLSRNFGSFSAVRAGLEVARGDRMSVMAADLQEPPELILEFDRLLRSGEHDVTVGVRRSRDDPAMSRWFSEMFWRIYKALILREIPDGGVDIFGCTAEVRDQLVALQENNSSLVGLLFWVGFRRAYVPYDRRAREIGESAWSLRKKLQYLADSVFSFTDLPVKALTAVGALGLVISVFFGLAVLTAKLSGDIPVPGYAATVLTVIFFGALNCFGLGIIGSYVARTLDNTKHRPNFVVHTRREYEAKGDHATLGPSAQRETASGPAVETNSMPGASARESG